MIVNSASEDLNLNKGVNTITQSIKFAAGEQAQACLEKVKRPVQVGEVIEGDAGNMTCKAVFHAILRQYISDNNKSSIEVYTKTQSTINKFKLKHSLISFDFATDYCKLY